MHPATKHLLQFFEHKHLPVKLQAASAPFTNMATLLAETLPDNPEKTVCLRKLLESKDAAVRAALVGDD